MRRRAWLLLGVVLGLAVVGRALLAFTPLRASIASIARTARDLRAILALQPWVRAQTSAADVQISLTSQTGLTLTLFNSPWNQLPPAGQQAKARELALRALQKYTGSRGYSLVTITLVDQPLLRGNAAPRQVATYSFTVQSLSP